MSTPYYEALLMVAQGAAQIAQMEADYEDTMFMALTERDVLLIGCALPALQSIHLEIGPASENLQLRLVETVRVQKPEWTNDGRTEE